MKKAMAVLCNKVLFDCKMPKGWELSVVVPIYKEKGDPMECNSYRAIKLLEHGMKVGYIISDSEYFDCGTFYEYKNLINSFS